jgi:hypothetical protein
MRPQRKPLPCLRCGKRPRVLPYTLCPKCREPGRKAASVRGWRTRRRRMPSGDRTEAFELPATGALPDLDALMAELDVAEAKALKAAASVKGVGGAPSRK